MQIATVKRDREKEMKASIIEMEMNVFKRPRRWHMKAGHQRTDGFSRWHAANRHHKRSTFDLLEMENGLWRKVLKYAAAAAVLASCGCW